MQPLGWLGEAHRSFRLLNPHRRTSLSEGPTRYKEMEGEKVKLRQMDRWQTETHGDTEEMERDKDRGTAEKDLEKQQLGMIQSVTGR